MRKRAHESDEEARKLMEEGQRSSAVMIERLQQLVKKEVISDFDLSYSPVVLNGRTVPRIIWTIERLLADGHLAGVEDAVREFCYCVGKGMSVQAMNKKQAK